MYAGPRAGMPACWKTRGFAKRLQPQFARYCFATALNSFAIFAAIRRAKVIEKDHTIISHDASRSPSPLLGIGRGISNWGHSPTAQIRVLLFLTLLPRRLSN